MLHLPHEVFALSGMVEGERVVRGGFAVAPSPEAVIEGLKAFGFRVVSVSSMADVQTSIEALEEVVAGQGSVGDSDYLDLLPPNTPRTEASVYTFTGTHDQATARLLAGFAAAPDRRTLIDHLSSAGFTTSSVVSLADLRSVYTDLQRFASGEYDENLVSFKP